MPPNPRRLPLAPVFDLSGYPAATPTCATYIYIYSRPQAHNPKKASLVNFQLLGCGLASCEVDCRDFSSRSFNYPQKLSELSVDSRTFRLRVPPVPEAGVCCLATRISYIKPNTRHTRLVYVHVKLQITYSLTI